MDIPESVLAQIGNRVQHALRAYTPNEQKAIRAAADSFRANPAFDTQEAIQALGTGEALVSVLDEEGVPTVVEKANILPPRSSMKAVDPIMLQATVLACPLREKYLQEVDAESAFEVIAREQEAQAEAERLAIEEKEKEAERKAQEKQKEKEAKEREKRIKNNPLVKIAKSSIHSVGREYGKKLIRGLLGNFLK
jgi:hypothetical protein